MSCLSGALVFADCALAFPNSDRARSAVDLSRTEQAALPLRLCGKTTLAVLLHAVDALDFRGRSPETNYDLRFMNYDFSTNIQPNAPTAKPLGTQPAGHFRGFPIRAVLFVSIREIRGF